MKRFFEFYITLVIVVALIVLSKASASASAGSDAYPPPITPQDSPYPYPYPATPIPEIRVLNTINNLDVTLAPPIDEDDEINKPDNQPDLLFIATIERYVPAKISPKKFPRYTPK